MIKIQITLGTKKKSGDFSTEFQGLHPFNHSIFSKKSKVHSIFDLAKKEFSRLDIRARRFDAFDL